MVQMGYRDAHLNTGDLEGEEDDFEDWSIDYMVPTHCARPISLFNSPSWAPPHQLMIATLANGQI